MQDHALDPELKAMLAAAAAAPGGPSIRDLPIADARTAYRERYLVRGIGAPEGVTAQERTLDLPGRRLVARMYRPASAAQDQPLPLVVYFHGGGFVVGDAAAYDSQSRWIARRLGVAVLTPDYRLAPEHPFPAAVEDAWDIFDAVCSDPAGYGTASGRIALAGDSAGGCLTLVTALTARDRPGHAQPAACLCLYPVTDYRDYRLGRWPSVEAFGRGYFLDATLLDWFCTHYFSAQDQAADPRASPLFWPDVRGMAPVVLATAGYDPLRDQGDAMADRLAQSGVRVQHLQLPDMIHNFPGYAGLSRGAERAFAQAVDRLGALLR